MNFSWLILLVFISAFIQVLLIPFNWIMILVLFVALMKEGREVMLLAFLAGLVIDLVSGSPWGISSLIFLIISFLIFLIRKRLIIFHPVAVFLLAFFSDVAYNFFLFHFWRFSKSLLFSLGLVLIYSRIRKKPQALKIQIENRG